MTTERMQMLLSDAQFGPTFKAHICAINEYVENAEELIELRKLWADFTGDSDKKAYGEYVWWNANSCNISFNGRFSIDDTLPLRKFLAANGFKLQQTNLNPDAEKYPENIHWRLARDEAKCHIWIGFEFGILQDGAPAEGNCRKVQVGTRTEEVPIYEIRCD